MTIRYVPFKLDAFQQVMDGIGFKQVEIEGTKEYVFERQVESKFKEPRNGVTITLYPFYVRIYSTVDKRTNETREKDSDAIRVQLCSIKTGRLIAGTNRKVLRTKSAFENTVLNARELFKYCANNICTSCNAGVMVKRKGANGPFMGCSCFVDGTCKHTQEIKEC